MERKNLDRKCSSRSSVSGGKHNRFLIFPSSPCTSANALERVNNCWFVRTNFASDLIVHVGENSFHMHKLSMVSRSGYLSRLVFKRRNDEDGGSGLNIQIDNLPGGADAFEFVVRFCYGLKLDLTAANIAQLYCAAHFLEMSEDMEEGNLISKAEAFLSFVLFSSWKDTIQILKSCEAISLWAKKLRIVKRCSESIAWKACMDPRAIFFGDDEALCFNVQRNANILKTSRNNASDHCVAERWWFEDVSVLRIDHFVEVINVIKRKGMRSDVVGACIVHWATKWVFRIELGIAMHNVITKCATIESLIRMLPNEAGSVSFSFLIHLLKVGLMMNINPELSIELERRLAGMLENCRAVDLLLKNYTNDNTVYDVEIVTRVVEAYVEYFSCNVTSKIFTVGKLVDEYLTLVSRDENISAAAFQLLAEALPKNARYCDDSLYRAIDTYLKSHPGLTEEERKSICRAMGYHKLSQDAREHALKNDRLPLNFKVQFILLEQVNMMRSLLADGSNYQRTKSQEIIRVWKALGKRWAEPHKELRIIKQEVERMKLQLNDLEMCRVGLQKQVKGGIK